MRGGIAAVRAAPGGTCPFGAAGSRASRPLASDATVARNATFSALSQSKVVTSKTPAVIEPASDDRKVFTSRTSRSGQKARLVSFDRYCTAVRTTEERNAPAAMVSEYLHGRSMTELTPPASRVAMNT